MRLEGESLPDSLVVDDTRVWVRSEDSRIQGWEFRPAHSPPVLLSDFARPDTVWILSIAPKYWAPGRPRLNIEDAVTGKEGFLLSGRYTKSTAERWDNRDLVAGHVAGEAVILDFERLIRQ